MKRTRHLGVVSIAVALGVTGYFLRFLDGPVQVFNGGPLRAGELGPNACWEA